MRHAKSSSHSTIVCIEPLANTKNSNTLSGQFYDLVYLQFPHSLVVKIFAHALTTILPVLSPVKRPIKACGILSKPSTTVSRTLILPEATQPAMALIPSTHRGPAHLPTKKALHDDRK